MRMGKGIRKRETLEVEGRRIEGRRKKRGERREKKEGRREDGTYDMKEGRR